jgi:hypothetical protein
LYLSKKGSSLKTNVQVEYLWFVTVCIRETENRREERKTDRAATFLFGLVDILVTASASSDKLYFREH